jgi:hypothetical protein
MSNLPKNRRYLKTREIGVKTTHVQRLKPPKNSEEDNMQSEKSLGIGGVFGTHSTIMRLGRNRSIETIAQT